MGLRYDAGKPRVDLVDYELIEEVGRVLAFGAEKYAPHNWRKGMSVTRTLGCALRHMFKFARGEDIDSESGLTHLGHAACNVMFLFWFMKHRPDLDDRYKNAIHTGGDEAGIDRAGPAESRRA